MLEVMLDRHQNDGLMYLVISDKKRAYESSWS